MKKFPLINRRKPTEQDLDNLGRYRAMTGSGKSPGSKDSGSTPEYPESLKDPERQLTPEELKIRRNDQDRERRLQQLQDKLEIQNELRESGYLIHKINC